MPPRPVSAVWPCSIACGLLVATTLSGLGRPLAGVLVAAALGLAGPMAVLSAVRAALGPSASRAAPAAAVVLSTLGVVTAERLDPGEGSGQAVAALLGAVVFLVAAVVGVRALRHRGPAFVPLVSGLAAMLLLLPIVPGLGRPTASGVHLAIVMAGVSVQPSELARPLVVLALAIGIADAVPLLRFGRRRLVATARVIVPALVPVGLLVLAGDFGPVLVLGTAAVIMLVLARPARPVVLMVVLAPIVAGLVAAAVVPTIRARVAAVGHPLAPDGALTHVGFGLRAIARGGSFGTGPGLGDPTAVRYAESDFVIAAIAEERGVVMVVIVLGLFAALTGALWSGAARAVGEAEQLAAAGLAALVAVQAVYTALGVLGVVPFTGMATPFVSLGGSAMVGMWLTAGLAVGLGASPSWPMRPAPRGPRSARRVTTAALLAAATLALSMAVAPPVGPGRPMSADWARQRGDVVARDGTVLARTTGQGADAHREYPLGALFAGPVGFTAPGSGAGLELYARDLLSCTDSLWTNITGRGCVPPTLVTTLAPDVQRAIAAGLRGTSGDAVVLDIGTGDVLGAYTSRAPADAYTADATSPGSVFKLVVAAAALRAGVPTDTAPSAEYTAPGGTTSVHNAGRVVGGGSLGTALAASSNTVFAELATRVGWDAVAAEADALLTWPQPMTGPAATPVTAGPAPRGPDELARTGFGQQGVRATPTALAVLAAEIGSRGLRPVPRLVAGACADGFVPDAAPEPARVLPTDTAAELGIAMERVVQEGRAPALSRIGVPVAAKTGTAERPDGLFDGLVVAYAPADRPRVAVAVRVRADPAIGTSRSGGREAAEVAAVALSSALSTPIGAHPLC